MGSVSRIVCTASLVQHLQFSSRLGGMEGEKKGVLRTSSRQMVKRHHGLRVAPWTVRGLFRTILWRLGRLRGPVDCGWGVVGRVRGMLELYLIFFFSLSHKLSREESSF